jgi:hypothetical protein
MRGVFAPRIFYMNWIRDSSFDSNCGKKLTKYGYLEIGGSNESCKESLTGFSDFDRRVDFIFGWFDRR